MELCAACGRAPVAAAFPDRWECRPAVGHRRAVPEGPVRARRAPCDQMLGRTLGRTTVSESRVQAETDAEHPDAARRASTAMSLRPVLFGQTCERHSGHTANGPPVPAVRRLMPRLAIWSARSTDCSHSIRIRHAESPSEADAEGRPLSEEGVQSDGQGEPPLIVERDRPVGGQDRRACTAAPIPAQVPGTRPVRRAVPVDRRRSG